MARNACKLILLAVACLTVAACATTAVTNEQSIVEIKYRLSALIEPPEPSQLGGFYYWDGALQGLVIDILDGKADKPFERQFKEEREVAQTVGSVISVSRSAGCIKPWWTFQRCTTDQIELPVFLELYDLQTRVIDNPQQLLEMLNRPLTGLPYNRNAEQRIQFWRSSLLAAIANARSSTRSSIVLASSFTDASAARVLVPAILPEDQTRALLEELQTLTRMTRADQESTNTVKGGATFQQYLFLGRLGLRVGLHSIDQNSTHLSPYVDFRLGQPWQPELKFVAE